MPKFDNSEPVFCELISKTAWIRGKKYVKGDRFEVMKGTQKPSSIVIVPLNGKDTSFRCCYY